MEIELDYSDMVVLFKSYGCDEKEAETRADYIEQCCSAGWNIRQWYYNSEGQYFLSKDEALEFIKENGLTVDVDCNIYESFNGGIWFEYY